MEFLPGGLTLLIPEGAFPLSTDSMVLTSFVRLPPRARVLDLGAGCGTLGHLLCARDDRCTVTGIELDPIAHAGALENIRRNGLEHRLSSICGDLRLLDGEFTGRFDCVISNPPYFSGGPASVSHPTARREDTCSCQELLRAAAKALKFGGDFFLVHRPERLAELIAQGAAASLEAKRLLLIRHRESGPITLIALQLRKGAKPGLTIEELHLFDSDNQPSQSYRRIYHMQED